MNTLFLGTWGSVRDQYFLSVAVKPALSAGLRDTPSLVSRPFEAVMGSLV
jgi:hypothetical protein